MTRSPDATRRRLRRVFLESFVALDVAEPLVSFDAERPSDEVRRLISEMADELGAPLGLSR